MSELTDILTARVNVRRYTADVFDQVAVAASLSPDRQPASSARMEVEIVGATVASGMVTIYASSGGGSSQYLLEDRTTGDIYGVKITNGQINWVLTSGTAASEPIVEDTLNSGTNWKIFISDGQLGWEVTATVQDDSVLLDDTVDSTTRKLVIYDGNLGSTVVSSTSEQFTFTDNDVKVGTTNFTTVTGLTLSGISEGFIKVRAITKTGQAINRQRTIGDSVACRFYVNKFAGRGSNRISRVPPGQDRVANYKMMAGPTEDIAENDYLYVVSGVGGLTLGQVMFVNHVFDFAGVTHHVEAEVIQL